VTQGEVETLYPTGADDLSKFLQPLSPTAHAVDRLFEAAFLLLFDHLAIDQL
jgi:hypothetical protein